MHKNSKKQCCLCSADINDQIYLILIGIERRLSAYLSIQTAELSLSENAYDLLAGFNRMIKAVFLAKFRLSKSAINCKHDALKKKMIGSLKCSPQLFNVACQKLAMKIGESNYHLDVLSQQIKGFQRYLKVSKSQSLEETPKRTIGAKQKKLEQQQPTVSKTPQEKEEILPIVKQEQPDFCSGWYQHYFFSNPINQAHFLHSNDQIVSQPLETVWAYPYQNQQ